MKDNIPPLSPSSNSPIATFFKIRASTTQGKLKENYTSHLNTFLNTLKTLVNNYISNSQPISDSDFKLIQTQITDFQTSANTLYERLRNDQIINECLSKHIGDIILGLQPKELDESDLNLPSKYEGLLANSNQIKHDLTWLDNTALFRNNLPQYTGEMFQMMERAQTSSELQAPCTRDRFCQYLGIKTNHLKNQLSYTPTHPTQTPTESWAEEMSRHFNV